ncbi:hypothetical protein SNE40_008640 [Patella caerulea]|uniref:Proliferation-associated SNF2-like protein n=1 Tax=Patella caerulea TaxID=87958 RepID=A0AAN8JRW0_PATCE
MEDTTDYKQEVLVTKEMLEEEKRLEEEGERREREMQEKHDQLWKQMSDDEHAEKYRKLQYLLTKSNMYTEYLISRMKKQREEKEMREEKKLKRLANKKQQEETTETKESTEEQDNESAEEKENRIKTVSEEKLPPSPRRTRTPKVDSDFEYSQESTTSRRSGRNKPATPGTPNSTSTRLKRNNTIDSYFNSNSQGSNSQKSGTSGTKGRKRKSEPIEEEAVNMEDFNSQESQNSLSSNRSQRSKKKVKTEKLTEVSKVEEIAGSETEMNNNVPDKSKESTDGTTVKKEKDEVTETKEGDEKRIINGQEVPELQPVLFTGGVLRQYQAAGFDWLQVLYENGINGILADEMGLGKTVQCVAMVAHLVNMNVIGPFLIVGPLSTLPNWLSEFKRFTPKIPVMLYHGSKQERSDMRNKIRRKVKVSEGIEVRPVIITSYEIAMIDKRFLSHHEWRYLIVDEGHRIKNNQCRLVKELKTYDSTHRLLLTGTPLQNNLAELWSLLNFLLPEIFDDLGSFESWFDIQNISDEAANEKIVADEKQNNILSMLHQILRPFMLRRLKTDVDLCIPPKKEILVYAPMAELQQELYKYTVDRTILEKIEEKNYGVEEIEYSEHGRPKRKSCGKVNYELMFEQKNESAGVDGLPGKRKRGRELEKEEEDLEAWITAISEMNNKSTGKTREKKSQVTIRLQNIMMQLRKCVNHPYLLEHPIDPETGYLKTDETTVTTSGKMMVLDKMLPELKKRGHKVLIFSQMTRMMDLLEDYCELRDYNYCRLDGSCSIQNRREQMELFNDKDGDMFLFLLSTRAGGLGINLVGADTCIIYDSDWNPQCDLQAQDRCHRIGQTRPVVVYRFVTANTIDQKIVERAGAKRKLEKMVIQKGKFKNGITAFTTDVKPISPEELLELLKSQDHSSIMSGKEGSQIDQSDLDVLLDRSDLYEKWEAKKQNNGKKKTTKSKKKQTKKEVEGKFFKVVDIYDDDSRSSTGSGTSK